MAAATSMAGSSPQGDVRDARRPGAGRDGDRLRVLHVIPSVALSDGGPSKVIGQMERVLAGRGHEVVTVATDDDGPGRRMGVAQPTTVAGPHATRIYFPLQCRPYKVSLPLLGWLKTEVRNFDVVHVHALFSFAPVAAAWVARSAGVPYIIRPLGVLNRYGRERRRRLAKAVSMGLLERGLLRDAAAVHFTADQERDEAQAIGVPMRARVVPLGIEAIDEVPADAFLQAFPGLGRRRLLFLSRIDPKKNIETLLEAVARCRRSDPELALIICGDGDPAYVAELKALASRLGLGGHVAWAGHVDGSMKASAFAAAQAFVLPSFSENFGVAVLEAMSLGLPCILGEGVALARQVAAAGAGVTIAPDAEALSEAIASTLADPQLLADMGARARNLARGEYSLAAMGEGLHAMYIEACAHRARARP